MISSYAPQVSKNKNDFAQQETEGSRGFDALTQMLMTALDTNKTGTIDKTEFTEAAKILAKSQSGENVANAFDKIDANSDAQISSDEFINAFKQLETQKEQHNKHAQKYSLESNLLSQQTQELIQQPSLQVNEMQKMLFDKMKAAYTTQTTAVGTTTNLSV